MPESNRTLLTTYVPSEKAELLRVVAFHEYKGSRSTLVAELIDEALEARGISDVDSYINQRMGSKQAPRRRARL
jgi:hypothetical protein